MGRNFGASLNIIIIFFFTVEKHQQQNIMETAENTNEIYIMEDVIIPECKITEWKNVFKPILKSIVDWISFGFTGNPNPKNLASLMTQYIGNGQWNVESDFDKSLFMAELVCAVLFMNDFIHDFVYTFSSKEIKAAFAKNTFTISIQNINRTLLMLQKANILIKGPEFPPTWKALRQKPYKAVFFTVSHSISHTELMFFLDTFTNVTDNILIICAQTACFGLSCSKAKKGYLGWNDVQKWVSITSLGTSLSNGITTHDDGESYFLHFEDSEYIINKDVPTFIIQWSSEIETKTGREDFNLDEVVRNSLSPLEMGENLNTFTNVEDLRLWI